MKNYQYNDELKNKSRSLRRSQTDAEKFLWQKIQSRQLNGFKFYRQYPFGTYILDFYCPSKRLAIELDGSQHARNIKYDEKRTQYLKQYGIRIVRSWDNDVLSEIDSVLEQILIVLGT